MLQPKRTKFRKQQKMNHSGIATRGAMVSFGDFGLQAHERGRLTSKQIEAARRAINRHLRRSGKMFIRVFPDKPISVKPLAVRMGRGKSGVEYWVAQVNPGRIIYEIKDVDRELAKEALRKGAAKLPIMAGFVEKMDKMVEL